jgi:hypothetical protein
MLEFQGLPLTALQEFNQLHYSAFCSEAERRARLPS